MTWEGFSSFVVFAVVVTLVPGPDFAVVLRGALGGGRARGLWAACGVATSCALQGVAVALGLGALVAASEPVFAVIRWVGVAYLVWLAVQAWRSAVAGRYDEPATTAGSTGSPTPAAAWRAWRRGFVSNVTNPKVLAFYLAVLPQFLAPGASAAAGIPLALTHAVISAAYLALVAIGVHAARRVLARRTVRRWIDTVTGVAFVGFGLRLAAEQA